MGGRGGRERARKGRSEGKEGVIGGGREQGWGEKWNKGGEQGREEEFKGGPLSRTLASIQCNFKHFH